ncbi:MAG TPA: DUF1329 domain-containing protein [Candidatus Binatia bacterium]|nr:DUF1329 domain-containing protein [Candidatus Binatia bacterium]
MRLTRPFAAVLAAALALGLPASGRADDLKAGETLDQSTWQKVGDLLPPEILEHYKKGEYQNPIAEWPADKYNWPPDFKAASEANEGKFKVGPQGEIQTAEGGPPPQYILGHPFPRIDAKDPQAGVKIIWNYFYRTYYFGNIFAESQVNLVAPGGLERRLDVAQSYAQYDGVPVEERIPNPENFLSQALTVVTSPADLNGTAALSWRYRDPGKRDSSWAYVPALRRVRAVSPANRSDGFLGSDFSSDDGPFFDGKPEDFEWKVVGEVDQLRIAEGMNLKGKTNIKWLDARECFNSAGGCSDTAWPDIPYIGYMDPSWKGVAWAPHGEAVLAKRRFWVVEGIPKDRYYLFGKLQLYIDQISFQGAWLRKFDWKGELLNVGQVMAWNPLPFTRPDGKVTYVQGGNSAYQTVESVKLDRATVAGIKSSPNSRFLGRFLYPPDHFSTEAMMRAGK